MTDVAQQPSNAQSDPQQGTTNASTRPYSHSVDGRVERRVQGLVKYQPEKGVPAYGATGWRTRNGKMLKNQQYYRSIGRFNLWNDPIHAGRDTWKCFHGPRLRTDAGLMEQHDKQDKRDIDWARRKQFVNESRQETIERFYDRKLVNRNMEHSSSWAPPYRWKREVCDAFDAFDCDLNALPKAAIKKIITPAVLERDEKAVKFITSNFEREAEFEQMYKNWEKHRQYETRNDFHRRRMYNDELQRISGQPVRTQDTSPFRHTKSDNYCNSRIKKLAEPKVRPPCEDHTTKNEYRGLVNADCRLALDTLRQGSFVATSNFCRAPHGQSEETAETMRKSLTLSGEAAALDIPVSPLRLTKPSGRHLHKKYEEISSNQITSNVGSPAHKCVQRHVLETREEQLADTPRSPSGPGPRHGAYTYPMKAPTEAAARRETRNRLDAEKNSKEQPYPSEIMKEYVTDSSLFTEKIKVASTKPLVPPCGACEGTGFASLSQGFRRRSNDSQSLKDDIDDFEKALAPQYVSHVGNFFKSDAGPARGRDV